MGKRSNQPAKESVASLCLAPIAELECRYCRRKSFSEEELRDHERSHLENKRFNCEICGVGIDSEAYKKEHMRTHSNTRPWQCRVCSKLFKSRSNMVCHQRIHDGDKRFKCDICHKSFGLKKHMQEHTYTHTKEKPFVCPHPQCGSKFSRRSTLVRHVKTRMHSEKRPFECAHCEWKFARRFDLQRHLVRYHEDSQKTKGTKNKKLQRTKAIKKASLSNLDDHQIKIEEVQVAIATVVDGTSSHGDDYIELLDDSEDITKEILPVPVEVINNNNLEENVVEIRDGGNNNFGDYLQKELSALSALQQLRLKKVIREFITEAKKV